MLHRRQLCIFDNALPGTEEAEFLDPLSHHHTRDLLLMTLLQTATSYSLLEVTNIDAGEHRAFMFKITGLTRLTNGRIPRLALQ
jgi:hypothetical protein